MVFAYVMPLVRLMGWGIGFFKFVAFRGLGLTAVGYRVSCFRLACFGFGVYNLGHFGLGFSSWSGLRGESLPSEGHGKDPSMPHQLLLTQRSKV